MADFHGVARDNQPNPKGGGHAVASSKLGLGTRFCPEITPPKRSKKMPKYILKTFAIEGGVGH